MPQPTTPLVLIVLDGWGLRSAREGNAIALARTPTYDELLTRFPHSELEASGEAVGLPPGQMGNSEVGHMNMGAGRIVYQDLTRIDKSIRDGDFFENPRLLDAMDRCRHADRSLHLLGLVSDGGVHSHERHLHALIELAARRKVERVFVHVWTDGRDSSPTGGATYVRKLQAVMDGLGTGRVASVSGRYYSMDRDRRWDRTAQAYDGLMGLGERQAHDAPRAIEQSYTEGVTDEFIQPTVIVDLAGRALGPIQTDDSVVIFNFRADRARQITMALTFEKFDGFSRRRQPAVHCTTMTRYDATYSLTVIFEPQTFSACVADVLAERGISNLRLAETEKYAHVTYFFNCGEERPYPGEDRVLVPSPKVPTYDLKPEMSAIEITDQLIADVSERRHDVIICNYANADMVGHTGKLEAAVAAVETLDRCLARLLAALKSAGGHAIITADHGNAELMIDPETGGPHTAHTSNPVPVVLVTYDSRGSAVQGGRLTNGSLRDIAPTMLTLLGVDVPREMTGRDLRG